MNVRTWHQFFVQYVFFQSNALKGSIWLKGSPSPCASVLKYVRRNWLRMVKSTQKRVVKFKGVGSEEDKEVDQSCSFANKVWG